MLQAGSIPDQLVMLGRFLLSGHCPASPAGWERGWLLPACLRARPEQQVRPAPRKRSAYRRDVAPLHQAWLRLLSKSVLGGRLVEMTYEDPVIVGAPRILQPQDSQARAKSL